MPAYTADWAEPQREEILWAAAHRNLLPKSISDYASGDVLLFRMREGSVAKHLGIVAEGAPVPTFIHAYHGHGVVESALTEPWYRRIVACFSFPEGQI